jgi:hypothetical protein
VKLDPRYVLRVLRGMSLEKFKEVLDRTQQFSGMSKAAITRDMIHCARKFGAGYYDYVTFGFWDLTDAQRDTYLTRMRNKKLLTQLNDDSDYEVFNSKEKFNEMFRDYIKRDFINFQTATKEEIRAFTEKHDVLFCKPLDGSCGHGCMKKVVADYPDFDTLYDELERDQSWLIEEVLEQHPDNAKVYPNAMNCCRVITLLDAAGEPHVIFVTQKFGLNGRVVDNYGFGCRVDLETGKICSPGVSGDGSMGIVYEYHPMTGEKIEGHQVPMFKEVCELAKSAAKLVPKVRYIGWDIGITPDGPAIIEGNNYCAHDFWQLTAQTPEKTGMMPVLESICPELRIR